MTTFGYALDYKYAGDGTLYIQTRIPSIHGPMDQREYKGNIVRNYTLDSNIPYYPSILLPHLPNYGDVVAVTSLNSSNNQFLIIGLTGGNFSANTSYNKGE